ncbi:hypothetical protein SMGD1_0323 [Sulfurimonas gotlandica GD1]|uniref:Methyl-accepting chemotaxis protein n=1 Tax=Sulfurimonas gotlandica (strain DSM 19862 / JCM 16533 / GD1) TaxID=929558 RepID=B6BNP7_SULGG|nr:hypothetical protein [Sulfurimonas gotlandica]EDZ61258.1 hypothetical protein CBGD1_83 [Sulfurimonas gotlandica GD1]EHP28850.1 hypothetical protein SMGD1_0323 [Sulfurimonas gotlandica GD1]
MAAWLPVLKTALPYVTEILKITIPAFTSRSNEKKSSDVIPDQILELQSAATQNAESVKVLATQLKDTIEVIESSGTKIEKELVLFKRISIISIIIAIVSIGFSIFVVLNK